MAGCVPVESSPDQDKLERSEPASVAGLEGPIILSTWDHGMAANAGAWTALEGGGTVLDAVERGVMVTESDFSNRSVGLGGTPDRDGRTTLDACIQDHDGACGAVACLEHIEHPVSVARAIMERTPHVMLVGEGAHRWAGARETYEFRALDDGTEVTVEMRAPLEYEAFLRDTWPKALAILKTLCEDGMPLKAPDMASRRSAAG